jgi:transposase
MAKPILDDDLWTLVEPMLPAPKPRRFRYPGRKPITNRQALTGIIFVLRTGIPWELLPQEMGCGSGVSCWRRLRDWEAAGIWQSIHTQMLGQLRRNDEIDLSIVTADSGTVRAVGAGEKRDRIRQIDASRAASTISRPTPRACRSRARSRARIAPMASSSSR